MLGMIIKFISSLLLSMTGYLAISNIQHEKIKFSIKNIVWILMLCTVTFIITESDYSISKTILSFLFMIIVYKQIFDYDLTKATIIVGIFMTMMFIGDAITSIIFIPITTLDSLRTDPFYMILSNISVSFFAYLISTLTVVKNKVEVFIKNVEKREGLKTIIVIILLILCFAIVFNKLSYNFKFNFQYLTDLSIFCIFALLITFYIQEQNKYEKLNNEYDSLFNYVQTFEDWIEDEQLSRHELKNSLAVIRGLTKDQRITEKIDEILQDSIKIEKKWIEQLKAIPKGGLKGLLYYKMAIAKNKDVDVVVDISNKVTPELPKLSSSELKSLFQLIGIYFDNAIEAASESDKKVVSLEIYLLKDVLNIVISNTFVEIENLPNIDKKGVTTKGKGHGNGRYFAQKIINRSKTMTTYTNVIDRYFVQKIAISI